MESIGLFTGAMALSMTVSRNTQMRGSPKRAALATTEDVDDETGTAADSDIKDEIHSRICSFFGEEKFKDISNAFVIVVGLGGVGSHAANMLVRSGVCNIRLIDMDQVTVSSLNRHALASLKDVGKSKAEVLKKRIKEIVPWCKVDAVTEMFKGAEADRLLGGSPTYVLDCIDDVSTKAELIAHCVKNNIKVLTSMGAGGKSDPTRLRVSHLGDCINDPLCSKIKWKLKKFNVLPEQVEGVFSNEKPCVDLLPLSAEQATAPQEFGAIEHLRLRIMPVLGTSPAIFGQAMASKVLCSLADKDYVPESCERMSKSLKHKLKQTLKSHEQRRFGNEIVNELNIDDEDIEFVVGQVWGSRCALTLKRFGGHAPLVMIRWNRTKPVAPDNLVLMLSSKAAALVEAESNGDLSETPTVFGAEETLRIEKRLEWARLACSEGGSTSGRLPLPKNSSTSSNTVITCAFATACFAAGYSLAVYKAFSLGIPI